MRLATLHQLVSFGASPEDVYNALMDSDVHAAFTGAPARISSDIGCVFTAHGPNITGINIALEPGRRIVQRWRLEDWPVGHYSVVTYEFEDDDGGTLLRFVHEGIPSDKAIEVDAGWADRYWKPLKKYLSASAKKTKAKAKTAPKKSPKKAKPKPKKKR